MANSYVEVTAIVVLSLGSHGGGAGLTEILQPIKQ